jgi:hypothetical protein
MGEPLESPPGSPGINQQMRALNERIQTLEDHVKVEERSALRLKRLVDAHTLLYASEDVGDIPTKGDGRLLRARERTAVELVRQDDLEGLKKFLLDYPVMFGVLQRQGRLSRHGAYLLPLHQVRSKEMLHYLMFDCLIDVNHREIGEGKTPLMTAAEFARLDVLEALLTLPSSRKVTVEIGAVDGNGNTALHHFCGWTAQRRNFPVKTPHGEIIVPNQLCNATKEGAPTMLELCIPPFDSEFRTDPYSVHVYSQRQRVFRMLMDGTDLAIRNTHGENVLHACVAGCHFTSQIKTLLGKRPMLFFEVDKTGKTPLHWVFDVREWPIARFATMTGRSDAAATMRTLCDEINAIMRRTLVEMVTCIFTDLKGQFELRPALGDQDDYLVLPDELGCTPIMYACDNAYLRKPLFESAMVLLHLPRGNVPEAVMVERGMLRHLASCTDLSETYSDHFIFPQWRLQNSDYIVLSIAERLESMRKMLVNFQAAMMNCFPGRHKFTRDAVEGTFVVDAFPALGPSPLVLAVQSDNTEFFDALMKCEIRIALGVSLHNGMNPFFFVRTFGILQKLVEYNAWLFSTSASRRFKENPEKFAKDEVAKLLTSPSYPLQCVLPVHAILANKPVRRTNFVTRAINASRVATVVPSLEDPDPNAIAVRHTSVGTWFVENRKLSDHTDMARLLKELGADVNGTIWRRELNPGGEWGPKIPKTDTVVMLLIERVFDNAQCKLDERGGSFITARHMITDMGASPWLARDNDTKLLPIAALCHGPLLTRRLGLSCRDYKRRCVACSYVVSHVQTHALCRAIVMPKTMANIDDRSWDRLHEEGFFNTFVVGCQGPPDPALQPVQKVSRKCRAGREPPHTKSCLDAEIRPTPSAKFTTCPLRRAFTVANEHRALALCMGTHPRLGKECTFAQCANQFQTFSEAIRIVAEKAQLWMLAPIGTHNQAQC